MEIISKAHSSYPRIGDKPEQQKLRRAYHQLDKKKITPQQMESALAQTIDEIIAEQLKSGCDLITDGQIRAYDPVSHVASKIAGFEIGGLLRFFDTNFYFRQPKLTSLPKYSDSFLKDEFESCRNLAGNKATCSILGPYSLLKLSISAFDFGEALGLLAAIYARELQELKSAGASLVQIDEPLIALNPQDFADFQAAVKTMAAGQNRPEILLGLYFADAAPLVDKLALLPVEGILFDFTYSKNLEAALTGFPKNLGLGLIDGRNTKIENVDELRKKADKTMASLKSQKLYITTSSGLEYLPRDRAFDKLKLTADFARALKGGK